LKLITKLSKKDCQTHQLNNHLIFFPFRPGRFKPQAEQCSEEASTLGLNTPQPPFQWYHGHERYKTQIQLFVHHNGLGQEA